MIKKINWALEFEIDPKQEQIYDLAFEGTLDTNFDAVIKYKKDNKQLNSNLIYRIFETNQVVGFKIL